MADIEESIKNMLKVSLKKQTHSVTGNNNNNVDDIERCLSKMLRVKYEYHDQTRYSLCCLNELSEKNRFSLSTAELSAYLVQ